ncbi:oligoendopeptidase F [Gemelliphila palaticanis]|uniref:Oligopeptidase F n=1 Tax=Gemelliphila palaticanis TaxID=81950 RepID=A0ABX2SZI3_9BACL|nr:oligoendopeptidase F [Gemella palaticanis]MBF0715567.1 oligoendopeptidase F [Gemella palaticanis]NYS47497.1 oligoendopeptidase F [Gemella palaticanis]
MTELLRKDVKLENTWDLTSIFKTDEDFWTVFKEAEEDISKISENQNKINKSAKDLLEVLKELERQELRIETLYVYAHLLNDQDTTEAKYKEMYSKTYDLYLRISTEWSFLTPELMEMDEDLLNSYLEELEELKVYKFYIEKINTARPHTLDKESERLIAMAGSALSASSETFSALNNTDVKFDDVEDKDGNKLPLNHGTYGLYMESKDRVLRKNTFNSMYKYYSSHINTLASTISGNVKSKKYYADTHNYKSTRHMALSNNHIPEEIYDNLVDTVNKNLNVLHKYHRLQKKVFGFEELRLYDRSISMIEGEAPKFDFEQAKEMVLEAVKPMGEKYVDDMKLAFDERWIDIEPNKGKRSGAYSSGGYNTKPYILLNYDNTLNYVFTLIHELGHSMHSYYTRQYQPQTYGSYSIFLAEVASTCNEALLSDYLYKKFEKENNKEAMLLVLNQELTGYVSTLFRQVMFAEFEHLMHKTVQEGGVLTSEYLNEKYLELVKKYHGDAFTYDEEIKNEWSRVPHFYYNYYVYQYATGFSAAQALSSLILEDSKNAEIYINEFLAKGNSNYPINILKNAGVDMSKSDSIERAIADFDKKIDEFERLYFENK